MNITIISTYTRDFRCGTSTTMSNSGAVPAHGKKNGKRRPQAAMLTERRAILLDASTSSILNHSGSRDVRTTRAARLSMSRVKWDHCRIFTPSLARRLRVLSALVTRSKVTRVRAVGPRTYVQVAYHRITLVQTVRGPASTVSQPNPGQPPAPHSELLTVARTRTQTLHSHSISRSVASVAYSRSRTSSFGRRLSATGPPAQLCLSLLHQMA